MEEKRATLVGIDRYSPPNELVGCRKDARDLATVLSRHENEDRKNFDCELVTDLGDSVVDSRRLKNEIDDLFTNPATCVLFYFAGHAVFDQSGSRGYFLTQGRDGHLEELPFDYLLERANGAFSRNILSTVIILDCCGSGAFADAPKVESSNQTSQIGNGVTILAASGRTQHAIEYGVNGGLFTQYMVEGLRGSAADLRGWVSTASVYSHIDHMLGPRGQRPVYKTNVQRFVTLRECKERIAIATLRNLPTLFKEPDSLIDLDPSFEPDRENIPEKLRPITQNPKNVETFKQLQSLNRQGLVVPVGAEHMYYATIESKKCGLTELGKHYRELAQMDRL